MGNELRISRTACLTKVSSTTNHNKRERPRERKATTMAPAMSVANKNFMGKRVVARQTRAARAAVARRNARLVVKAGAYDEELIATANTIASAGRGILAMDESNGTCRKRLDSIGVENTEDNRRAYRGLLVTTPGLGEYISGAILFEETLYQSGKDGKTFVDTLKSQNIVPGIKVDKGLVPMANSNGESWCQGLDGLAERCAEYYKLGARFAKWRSVVNIAAGPSDKALNDCAYGLPRDCCRVHLEDVEQKSPTCRPRNHVLVWWPV